ncbi:MAG: SpoIID/LytB domain-containing protein [Syntrophales bacterium]
MIRMEPTITVGIIDRAETITGAFRATVSVNGRDFPAGSFRAVAEGENVVFSGEQGGAPVVARCIRCRIPGDAPFVLRDVTIGVAFHWERRREQVFRGDLVLECREGLLTAVNEIPLEAYLESVVSSEMSPAAPPEFLRAHAVLSRSWLLAMLERKAGASGGISGRDETDNPAGEAGTAAGKGPSAGGPTDEGSVEIRRWYGREDHEHFDVCADDHCQRYQGVGAVTEMAREAVAATRGRVLTWRGEVCDARYSKCCGGRTERFESAWEDVPVPYLVSVADGPASFPVISNEEEAERWIRSEPEACCRVRDPDILKSVLPDFDRETPDFFRWRVEYGREELQAILEEKSGLDLGDLLNLVPLERGPSGRIVRLRIEGSRRTVVVGKELEIRRWLSRSHLYSSAFVVEKNGPPSGLPERFVLRGAGWGHGVGLCQIGAAALACRGFTAEEILARYFPGTSLTRLYD